MNDVLTLAVFAAKVLCLIVFVFILKPDGSIGAVWTSTNATDCTEASGKQSRGLAFFPAVSQGGLSPCIAGPSVVHR